MKKLICPLFFISWFCVNAQNQDSGTVTYKENYRPLVHFSPGRHWTNDPNGMVFHNGVYHLFFQYFPGGNTWGPMHWGHAESRDLVHWREKPIALYPDSLGYIFSGSAVVDADNTAGFGKHGKVPLVAIFTHHDPKGEQLGNNDFQNQSLAFSLDDGETWTKYPGNPVLKNPGIKDFRDPKVSWYAPGKKWMMTLATKDRISFYSSPDLKNWKKESEFGASLGAHGGVWECPDLFPLNDDGKTVWVLIVNINPGGPNGGSATQYFLGNFNGNRFMPADTITRWLDYGPDEYAGITWANTGNRRIFLGWMSNWQYANLVPTEIWRNAMTLPRELKIKHTRKGMVVGSEPVAEIDKLETGSFAKDIISFTNSLKLSTKIKDLQIPCRISLAVDTLRDFSIVLANSMGEETEIAYDLQRRQFSIDRSRSGEIGFEKGFGTTHFAPRFSNSSPLKLTLLIDVSSVELFADDGMTVMTEIYFPHKNYDDIKIKSAGQFTIKRLEYAGLKSIW